MILTPTKELLDLPEDERIAWAEALESGRHEQYQNGGWAGSNQSCCLHVKAIEDFNSGVWASSPCDMEQFNPDLGDDWDWSIHSLIGEKRLADMIIATASNYKNLPKHCCSNRIGFIELNDVFFLTFPQIAQIIRGNEVEVEG